jgi:hypothetical protein
MTDTEFRDWPCNLVLEGRVTAEQRDDLLAQKDRFDQHRAEIEKQCPRRVVGYVNGAREVASAVHEILSKANAQFPGRMVYFEPIGFEPF